MKATPIARIASLHIYPIKSCAGFEVERFEVGPRGPLHDREWMIVDAGTNDFLTQRQLPQLTQVKTQLTPTELIVEFQQKIFSVALRPPAAPKLTVTIWKESCEAIEEQPALSRALSDVLEKPVRIVRIAPAFKRKRFSKYNLAEAHTGFADGYPLLLASLSSVADLNSRLPEPVSIDRFRANIVIEGAPAFAEDSWSHLRIGSLDLDVVKPCERCVIITTDQQTGARKPEPLKTLAGYRRNANGKVIFGQNLIHLAEGLVGRDDPVFLR